MAEKYLLKVARDDLRLAHNRAMPADTHSQHE